MSSAVVGRFAELGALDVFLARIRGGDGSALVVHGEPGSGKTALLGCVVGAATGLRVAGLTGLASETGLPFAGLQRLLGTRVDGIEHLPAPQRAALEAVLGLRDAAPPEPFLVGLAVLGVLSVEQPVLYAVDDADLLDRASLDALAFAAHRLAASRIGLVFAVRESTEAAALLGGLPQLRAVPLLDADSHDLLASIVAGRLHGLVSERIVDEARGNPLALVELRAALTVAQLAGTVALPVLLPLLGGRLEAEWMKLVRMLPAASQALLLLAAAAPDDLGVLWTAAAALGLAPDTAGPLEAAGLISLGGGIAFRPPLVRSAVYGAADSLQRREVHRALADAIDPETDPDRRAWHRAESTVGADDDVADELERSAGRAGRRGGYAAAATLLGRAAQLTPGPERRAGRLIATAEAELAAGGAVQAAARLTEAESHDELPGARTQRLAGRISFALGDGDRTSELLAEAAQAFEPVDARLARDTYLEALEAALYTGTLTGSGGIAEVTRAASLVPAAGATPADDLLEGFAALVTEGQVAAEPALRRGIERCERGRDLRWLGLAFSAATDLRDDESMHTLAKRRVRLARAAGALTALPVALAQLGAYEVLVGRLDLAEAHFTESRAIAAATGNPGILGRCDPGALLLAAWRGSEAETRRLATACTGDATTRGLTSFVGFAHSALCVLELSLGNYPAALAAAREASEDPWTGTRVLPDLVEAATHSGDLETAAAAARRLADATSPAGTDWSLGLLAQSRALTSEDGAGDHYLTAIAHLKRCRVAPQLARTRLLYGEWLRRERRRRDAREQLAPALGAFELMGLTAFADRARAELQATGAHMLPPSSRDIELLTPRERAVATVAATGATNREIAVQLFISPRTVEYHLHKVFRKLGIGSRVELVGLLLEERDSAS